MSDNTPVTEQEYEVSQNAFSRRPDQQSRNQHCSGQPCTTTACQYADVCIPVEVNPNAVIGEIQTECCGRPSVNCRENSTRRNCEITIEQKIRIRIPIRYSATAKVGEVSIDCSGACECDSECSHTADCRDDSAF